MSSDTVASSDRDNVPPMIRNVPGKSRRTSWMRR